MGGPGHPRMAWVRGWPRTDGLDPPLAPNTTHSMPGPSKSPVLAPMVSRSLTAGGFLPLIRCLVLGWLALDTLPAYAACRIFNLGTAGMLPPIASRKPTGVEPNTPKLALDMRLIARCMPSLMKLWSLQVISVPYKSVDPTIASWRCRADRGGTPFLLMKAESLFFAWLWPPKRSYGP